MASLIKKRKKGKLYYYAVESQRVNGKPRIVNQIYLGSVDKIIENHQSKAAPAASEVDLTRFGPSALWDVAASLNIPAMIDETFPKRKQGPSISQFLLLAVLNRAFAPCSKVKIGQWYEETSFKRLWSHKASAFTSQRFWDAMNKVDLDKLARLESEIYLKVASNEKLAPKNFWYDCTNYFTYIDTLNDRNTEAKRGRNKQGRHNLRQLGLAIAVTSDFHIPLYHSLYPGNLNDITQFKAIQQDLIDRMHAISGDANDITLVFDKGNMAEEILYCLQDQNIHVVGSTPIGEHKDLLKIDQGKFHKTNKDTLPGVTSWRTKKEIMGKEWTLVLVHSTTFAAKQYQSTVTSQAKAIIKLEALAQRLRRGEMPKATVKSVKEKVKEILKVNYMKDIIGVEVLKNNDRPVLDYWLESKVLNELKDQVFGKTILLTNRHDWTDSEIIITYRGQSEVERFFQDSKDPDHLTFQPPRHWTDQKIHVHTFYCTLAMTLTGILRRRLSMQGLALPTNQLLDELHGLSEATLFYPPTKKGPPRLAYCLVKHNTIQNNLLKLLKLDKYIQSLPKVKKATPSGKSNKTPSNLKKK